MKTIRLYRFLENGIRIEGFGSLFFRVLNTPFGGGGRNAREVQEEKDELKEKILGRVRRNRTHQVSDKDSCCCRLHCYALQFGRLHEYLDKNAVLDYLVLDQ